MSVRPRNPWTTVGGILLGVAIAGAALLVETLFFTAAGSCVGSLLATAFPVAVMVFFLAALSCKSWQQRLAGGPFPAALVTAVVVLAAPFMACTAAGGLGLSRSCVPH